jgi:hypothetical protein
MKHLIVLVALVGMLAGCRAASPTPAPTATIDIVAQGRAELAELFAAVSGRLDALGEDGALLADAEWRRALVADARYAALLAESLAMRTPAQDAALRAVAGAFTWLADSAEVGSVAGVASAGFALSEAAQGLD